MKITKNKISVFIVMSYIYLYLYGFVESGLIIKDIVINNGVIEKSINILNYFISSYIVILIIIISILLYNLIDKDELKKILYFNMLVIFICGSILLLTYGLQYGYTISG